MAEQHYVKVGTETLTTLVVDDDGTYSSHSEDVVLPSEAPELVASIVDGNGEFQASQLMELWNQNEDIELFDLQTGNRLDGYSTQRSLSKEYGLLASTDLEIEPPDIPFHQIGSGSNAKRLYRLPSSNEHPVRVTLYDEEIWNSSIDGGTSPKPPESNWSRTVTTDVRPTGRIRLDRYEGSSVRISGIESGAELVYVRIGGRPLDFHLGEDGDYLTKDFDITREVAAWNSSALPAIKIKLGLRRGNEQVGVERTNILNVSGVLRVSDDGWQMVNREDKLMMNDARQVPYKVLLPGAGQDADRLALLEGPIFLKRLWGHPKPLGQLGGYGAPLELRPPYNFTNFKMVVSAEVHDPGIFEWVLAGDNRKIRLYLRHPLDLGSGHKIILWNPGKPPDVLDAIGNVEHQGSEWDVSVPSVSFEYGFIALAYNGARIGSWWPTKPDWSGIRGSSAMETAALLKWMHAPIVSSDWLDSIRSFAQQYPAQTLSAWLQDTGLPSGLDHEVTEEQWRAAVRQVFAGWDPDGESAWEIISALGQASADDPIAEALQVLLDEDPLLMGRVARAWIRSPNLPCPEGAKDKQDLIKRMRFLIAALDPQSEHQSQEPYQISEELEASLQRDPQMMARFTNALLSSQDLTGPEGARGSQLEQREEVLLNQVSTLMSVDENFVKQGIVRRVLESLDYHALEIRDRYNAETALGTAPFREYLGLRVLSSLLQEIRSYGAA